MSLYSFVHRVDHLRRMAAVAPTLVDQRHGRNGAIERVATSLADADLWLAGVLCRHFCRDDFAGMEPATLDELERRVRRFDEIADGFNFEDPQNPGRRKSIPTTPEGRREGWAVLSRIGEIVDAHLNRRGLEDEEAKVRAALTAFGDRDADAFTPIDYRLDTDSTGDPAVWIWGAVPEGIKVSDPEFTVRYRRFSEGVRDRLLKAGVKSWPHINVRKRSEQRSLLSTGAGP